MTIGPEPMSRIFFRSVRRGLAASQTAGGLCYILSGRVESPRAMVGPVKLGGCPAGRRVGAAIGSASLRGAGLAFVSHRPIRFARISLLGNEFFLLNPLCRLPLGRFVSAYYGTPPSV